MMDRTAEERIDKLERFERQITSNPGAYDAKQQAWARRRQLTRARVKSNLDLVDSLKAMEHPVPRQLVQCINSDLAWLEGKPVTARKSYRERRYGGRAVVR